MLQAVKFVRVERCPARSVLPSVGLAAGKVTRDEFIRRLRLPHPSLGADSVLVGCAKLVLAALNLLLRFSKQASWLAVS